MKHLSPLLRGRFPVSGFLFLAMALSASLAFGQNQGTFSGGLQANTNVFFRDSAIGAANTPQYDNLFSGSEGWLNLNYSNFGFNLGLRFDFYNNSNLPDPQDAYSGQGIGYWYINRKVAGLDITAGHFYDQIGSGIIFRAYEERLLALDNSVLGLRLIYDLAENWKLKGMVGKQRNPFGPEGRINGVYRPVINAFSIDGYLPVSDKVQIAPGFGFVNRILDDESMNLIVAEINTYAPIDSFIPKFNTYSFSINNRLTVGDFSWFAEAAFKTSEAIVNAEGLLVDEPGSILYTSLSYSRKGLGITLQGKRTENFVLRTSPLETLNNGLINFLPPLARQNTKRLTSRYNANTQFLGEYAFQADVLFKPAKKITSLANFAYITDLDGNLLFREVFLESKFKRLGELKKWDLTTGLQFVEYNQEVYEVKPGVPNVQTVVPMMELLYRIDRKKSIRTEFQYMHTDEDFGSFLFALAEFSIAPSWTVSISDMYNIRPKKTDEKVHYYNLTASYTKKSNKFILSFVRQVEGIVCTGGVCRFEPAFNGIRFTVNSSF